jgi:hypothetical protein
LSVEIDDVNDAAIGYLARPYVPDVQVVERRRGPWDVNFDLPGQSASVPYALGAPLQLAAPLSLGVSYADGVRAVSASTTRTVTPGESLGLALTWSVDEHSPQPLTNRLVWEMSVYDPSGHEVRRVAGMAHDWSQLTDGEVVVSWLTVATGSEFAEGMYQVKVDRLDPAGRRPVSSVNGGAEWNAGTVELRKR